MFIEIEPQRLSRQAPNQNPPENEPKTNSPCPAADVQRIAYLRNRPTITMHPKRKSWEFSLTPTTNWASSPTTRTCRVTFSTLRFSLLIRRAMLLQRATIWRWKSRLMITLLPSKVLWQDLRIRRSVILATSCKPEVRRQRLTDWRMTSEYSHQATGENWCKR